VLSSAGATAAGLAAARILTLRGGDAVPQGTVTTQDWVAPLDRPEARMGHLLRRTTFAPTGAQLESALRDGYARTVDQLIETPAAEPPPLAGADQASNAAPLRLNDMRVWWLSWMLDSPTPFAERMTLFWHGHFTSDYRKVGMQFPYLYWQNLTWRRQSLGNLHDFLMQVTIDPAMLRYLDLHQSTGRAPNENYSREVMELFTMGAGTFTENDVRNGAKAFAGWREPLTPQLVQDRIDSVMRTSGRPPAQKPLPDTGKVGIFERTRAFVGPAYSFLGGDFKLWDTRGAIDQILANDNVAPHLTKKVLREFVTPDPPDDLVKRIAEPFRKSRYDVKTLMRDVLNSPEFSAPQYYRSLVRSPIEFLVAFARAMEIPTATLAPRLAVAGTPLGMGLFDMPEVGGWPTNGAWISSASVLQRVNFVVQTFATINPATLQQPGPRSTVRDFIARHLENTLSPSTTEILNAANDDLTRRMILAASPEFQLK